MEGDLRLLIADPSRDYLDLMAAAVSAESDICLVGCASDGESALSLVHSVRADVLLIDLLLPGRDGLYVLCGMEKMVERPSVVVNTSFISKMLAERCSRLNVAAVLLKPCDASTVLERVRYAHSYALLQKRDPDGSRQSLWSELSALMLQLGLPAHHVGYAYLREAVLMVIREGHLGRSVTTVIYPEVANKFGSTAIRVEHAIRSMLDYAWRTGARLNLQRDLGLDEGEKRPSNAQIIALLAEHLRCSVGIDGKN